MASRHGDLLLALFVVAIAMMLLVPLPTPLLDVLIVINLATSLLVLLAGLYMPNALALLSFPSLLLLSTLFRLALNVASSRLILSQADAGRVIEAFGTLLIRNEVVVGMLIFLIITVVNFIVIARGSSRVSEVAARFALDALPGKQLAIDADLRAGLLSAEQAHTKREDLRKESQLYGAMDGGMRFVQGDAVAGIVIIVVNILGGMYMGLSSGLTFHDAIHTYTTLTVGDGLVSQIPALLISIGAGIVVTRVAAAEHSTLGADIGVQLFGKPVTLAFAGTLLIGSSLLPGVPLAPFLVVGMALLLLGGYLRRQTPFLGAATSRALEYGHPAPLALGPGEEQALPEEGALVVRLEAQRFFRAFRVDVQRYHAFWQSLRHDVLQELGVKLPDCRFVPEALLPSWGYRIDSDGVEVARGTVPHDGMLVEMNPGSAHVFGLQVLRECEHPLFACKVFWTKAGDAQRRVLDGLGVRHFDPLEAALLAAAAFIVERPEETFTLSEVHNQLKQIERRYPGLLADVLDSQRLNPARLTEALQYLVRDGVNVRDMRQMLEGVGAFSAALVERGTSDIELEELVSFLRISRRRQICGRAMSGRRTLRVIGLDPEVESVFDEAPMASLRDPLILAPEQIDRLSNGLERLVGAPFARGVVPLVVVCRGELRGRVQEFMRTFNALRSSFAGAGSSKGILGGALVVLASEEVDPTIVIERAGTWAV